MATKVSKNFTLEELTFSETAQRLKINNVPKGETLSRLKETVGMMAQPIRDLYGKGIKVTSGYRSEAVNAHIKGASNTSMHTKGYALDIKPTGGGDMRALVRAVLSWAKTHNFDQVILEKCDVMGVPQWIHIGWKHLTKGQRRQILTAKQGADGKFTYYNYKG